MERETSKAARPTLGAAQDLNETAKEVKLKETLANLHHLFPGIIGRMVDLCKPTARKFKTAVSAILGRNIDAVVVENSCRRY